MRFWRQDLVCYQSLCKVKDIPSIDEFSHSFHTSSQMELATTEKSIFTFKIK